MFDPNDPRLHIRIDRYDRPNPFLGFLFIVLFLLLLIAAYLGMFPPLPEASTLVPYFRML